jgi:hypothetical protein
MSDVVNFPTASKQIWVCLCGCSTFQIFDDGSTECSACGQWTPDDGGGWVEELAGRGSFEGDCFADTQGNGSVEFARARAAKIACQPDVKLVVTASESGALVCWHVVSNEEQRAWALEKLDAAKKLIEGYDLG